jgi:aspartate beta-hydroxylase
MNSPLAAQLQSRLRDARELARTGRGAEAARLWMSVLETAPGNVEALLALGQMELSRRNPVAALPLLQRAAAPGAHPMAELCLALAHKDLGDQAAEAAAVRRALAIDPYFYPALLHEARMLEREGRPRQAARAYRNVLKAMPERDLADPSLQHAVQHARGAVERNVAGLEHYLQDALGPLRHRHHGARLERFERSLEVMIGKRTMYQPQPVMLHYADLPPIQFHDDALFPWMAELESSTDVIRDELVHLLAEGRDEFRPYVQHPAGAPLQQWAELNHSPRWSTYFLWEHGRPVAAHCERCPRTASILAGLPMAELPNFLPDRHVLLPRGTHHHPPALRRDQHAAHRAPAARRPGGLLVPGRQRDTAMAVRQGLRVRRHDRARGAQRQRGTARGADLRRLESIPRPRRTRAGRGPRQRGPRLLPRRWLMRCENVCCSRATRPAAGALSRRTATQLHFAVAGSV